MKSNSNSVQEKAFHLKEALSRIDRDKDGLLSFQASFGQSMYRCDSAFVCQFIVENCVCPAGIQRRHRQFGYQPESERNFEDLE
jgi:hypothetical protein